MNPFRLRPGKKRFWVVTALAGAAVVAMIGLDGWGFAAVRRDQRVLAAVRRELAIREEQQKAVVSAGRALKRLNTERALIESSFADPAEPLEFIETIERLARRLGLRAELQFAGESGAGADAYDVSVEGPFSKVFAFFQRLESLPYLVKLDEVDLARSGGASGGGGRGETVVRLGVHLRLVPFPASR